MPCVREMRSAPISYQIRALGERNLQFFPNSGMGIIHRFFHTTRTKDGKEMAKEKKPGQIATDSGIYERIGPRGGKTGHQVTVVEGEPLPPTTKPKETYVIVQKTKHPKKGN